MEESGIIVIKASDDVEKAFKAGIKVHALDKLQEYAEVDDQVFIRHDALYDTVEFKKGYIILDYDGSYTWSGACSDFIEQAQHIEFYAYTSDEYGTEGFFSLNERGERICHIYHGEHDEEDEEDEDAYETENEANQEKWEQSIPKVIRKIFD